MLRIKRDSQIALRQVQQEYVPLKRVTIDATIRSFAADVSITQVFVNDETTPIEAVYCFPIEEQAAVYAFVAHIDDREIVARLKEKKEAQKEYNEALQQGHGAYLLEQDEKSQDNFIINVGALPPGQQCQITISYVSELDLVQNGTRIRFVVPTTIAPRYNPNKGGITSPADTTSKYVQSSPYTVEFRCQVEKLGVVGVSSTSYPIEVTVGQDDAYMITSTQQNTHLDRDILVDIELAEKRSNTIVAVEAGAVMASFTPTEKDCEHGMENTESNNEFIFVVDCSGSMQAENKIGLARQAMLLFLKSLPVNCHFNIVRFGSTYVTLFKEITATYNEETARQAEQYTGGMQADLGGTELLRPLQWLEEHSPVQGRARQIFLLTDGEISNVDEVLNLCRSMVTSARIFSFGLGHSPSRSLVKGLARATNGRFVFIPPNTSVDVHVGEQLQKALQSCITNVEVKWNLGTAAMNVPMRTPPVYVNDRLIVYALLEDKSSVFDHNSSVQLKIAQHRLGEANVTRVPSMSDNETIARLAAKALILELQHSKLPPTPKNNVTGPMGIRFEERQETTASNDDGETAKEMRKKRIVELSLQYNILSPHTAFVGVEKRMNTSNDDMVLREVPIQISTDDQHLALSSQMYLNAASSMRFHSLGAPLRSMSASTPTIRLMSAPDRQTASSSGCCGGAPSLPPLVTMTSARRSTKANQSTDKAHLYRNDGTLGGNEPKEKKEELWPTDHRDIVRHLINKQKFDGSWNLDSKSIEQLTGKPLADFRQSTDVQMLVSAIVIAVLETRFASFSSMWHGVVQKARKRLIDLFDKDIKKLDILLDDIRKQL